MNRKIIIISHDSNKYKAESGYRLSKLIAGIAKHINKSYLAAYDLIESNHTSEGNLDKYLKDNKPNNNVNLKQIKTFINEVNLPNKWYEIPESLIEYYKEDKESDNYRNPYDKIEIKDNNGEIEEIFILYWNRTEKYAIKPGLLLSLVCKDCKIDETTDNLLYIHESEWLGDAKLTAKEEEKGDNFLIFDGNAKTNINESILEELKKRNFSFAATFKHVDSPDRFFHEILNLRFGGNTLLYEMGLKENATDIKDFISLKNEIESLC